ncbi:MAG: carboxypeptidase regulatory-like domain-containing protein, partial [Planctomycetes bacterium]|nr:carboxypeptidase regulatory-like domain-containing protein [Planctomycetota bacterium]
MLKKMLLPMGLLLFFSNILYAFDTGTFHGKVIDGFGKPVIAVDVVSSSDSSRSKAISDQSGNFAVSYHTGNIKITFKKDGYVPFNIPLSLDEASDLSLGDITLWKIPPKGGLFVVGSSDYAEINATEYYSESSSKERQFYVKGSPTVIKSREFKIIDFQTDSPLVTGKTLYSINSKGSMGSITFYPSQKYNLNQAGDTYSKIADNVGMRKINLP